MAINPITGLEEEIDPETGLPKSEAAPAQAPAVDVRKYIMEKYGLGDQFSDEARQKLVKENEDAASPIASAFAGFGAGLRGGDVSAAFDSAMKGSQAKTTARLNEFDKSRNQKISDFDTAEKFKKSEREEKAFADAKDPMSERSKAAQNMLIQDFGFDPSLASKMSAEQIEARIPTLKAKLDREFKDRELSERSKDRQLQREVMRSNKETARNDKLAEKAKLSDKQVAAFTDLDNAESDLNNLLASLGDKSNWTGPVDGRVPDMLVGDDQVAWRSAVGKYKDAYRKAITGAGAGPTEIAMLEKRLPSETDTIENFKSKANEAIKELQRRRQSLASNLGKAGKNTEAFANASDSVSTKASSPAQFPMKVRKDGQVATVNDENELKEAREEGWQ